MQITLVTYGGWVTSGVLEEKSSRVVEVILCAIRPRQLLAGKVIGIGLLALGQFAAVALAGTTAAISVGRHLPPSTPGAIGLIVVWFVLGYAFYCCAFAAAGPRPAGRASLLRNHLAIRQPRHLAPGATALTGTMPQEKR